jgi:hypothetical protein
MIMDVNFEMIATSKKVCRRCCDERGAYFRWGRPEIDDMAYYDDEDFDSFYCPVLKRTIYDPTNVGTVQAECPRKFEHAKEAGAVAEDKPVQLCFFEPEHASYHMHRLEHGVDERVYLEEWRRQNARQPGINRGFTYIEHILCPQGQRCPDSVSQRDAFVAASVIQWLGTNCGSAFIHECERRIKKEKGLKGYLERKQQEEERQRMLEAKNLQYRREVAEKLMGYVWALFTKDEWFFLTEGKPEHRTGIHKSVGGWVGLEHPLFEERRPEHARGFAEEFSVSAGFPTHVPRSKVVKLGLI